MQRKLKFVSQSHEGALYVSRIVGVKNIDHKTIPFITKSIEHSENKIIGQSRLFENEIGPEVLQCSIQ